MRTTVTRRDHIYLVLKHNMAGSATPLSCYQVCGTLRCPCYGLEPLEKNKGFGKFLQNGFAGSARQQLVRLVREKRLVEPAVLEAALSRLPSCWLNGHGWAGGSA